MSLCLYYVCNDSLEEDISNYSDELTSFTFIFYSIFDALPVLDVHVFSCDRSDCHSMKYCC